MVGASRVAGDQELDQLLADEGADVGMVEDQIQRVRQVLFRGLARGKHHVIEERLGG